MLEDEPPQHPLTHPCPACGQPVDLPTLPTGQPLQCAACGEQFIIDDEQREPQVELPVRNEDELDTIRIERISKLKRSLYRSRSHAIIAAAACAVGSIQLMILLAQDVGTAPLSWRSVLYVILLIPAAIGLRLFTRTAIALHRQVKQDHPTG